MEERLPVDRIRARRSTREPQEQPAPSLTFPPAAKYGITYTKANGETVEYVMSNPIEESAESITAYVFGRGVRTFIKARVSRLSKLD
jgi:hypothetical protein